MQHSLEKVEFRDPARARKDFAQIETGIPERIKTRIEILLASVPDPDEALHYLERLHQESPAAFGRIVSSTSALKLLITTFSYSHFLSDALLRRPEFVLQLNASGTLHRMLTSEELEDDLLQFLGNDYAAVPSALMLARFRRRQILR